MRITEIREKTVPLSSPMRNARIGFGGMTASALVIVTDVIRHGKQVVGLAFDSVGRYGHGGLLRERFIPRLLAADPYEYADARGAPDPFKVWSVVMRDEKPGGHGERPGAVGLIDAAVWDLAAKLEEKPLWHLLAERFGDPGAVGPVSVYASGGHYRSDDDRAHLGEEIRRYRDLGYRRVKIKCGGLPLAQDLRRIEAAIGLLGSASDLAVDCNGTMTKDEALALLTALADWGVAWVEEPVDPLDYGLHAELARRSALPLATGENLFSAADTLNLLRHAGLRPDRDLLQMDISLSYGIVEYLKMLDLLASHGWPRAQCYPHAGHLLALNVVAGLGLGCHEASPDPDSLLGGFPAGTVVADGQVGRPEVPGVGIEAKPNLYAAFADLLA
jgi:L-alanine-DL-glutamate epimerase-like enolase superfamily enzyme